MLVIDWVAPEDTSCMVGALGHNLLRVTLSHEDTSANENMSSKSLSHAQGHDFLEIGLQQAMLLP
jgi:hypothetical protein